MVKKVITKLDSLKTSSPDCILVMVLKNHSGHPLSAGGRGGVEPHTKFSKRGGAWQDLNF